MQLIQVHPRFGSSWFLGRSMNKTMGTGTARTSSKTYSVGGHETIARVKSRGTEHARNRIQLNAVDSLRLRFHVPTLGMDVIT